jgi:hypothetical protein
VNAADVAGWAGALVLIASYAANSAGAVAANSRAYQAMNASGSVGLAALARAHHAWPSFALNVLWLGVAAVSLRRTTIAGRGLRPRVHAD